MAFELTLTDSTPVTNEKDLDSALIAFLLQIGYLSKRYRKKDRETIKRSIGYRLIAECFLLHPERVWRVDEITNYLKTSAPTAYRHLNKLRSLDLIEEIIVGSPDERNVKRGYRIRYGSLSKAWSFPEAHIRLAMENFRKSVDHIQSLLKEASG